MAGLEREIWKDDMLAQLRAESNAHFEGIADYSEDLMNGSVLHLQDIGVDPEILVNNTTYPIATVVRTDSDIALTLDLLETKNTKIPYQSLFSIPYNKVVSVNEQHKDTLMEGYIAKGTHAVAPSVHSANTPVLVTTGTADALGRKALLPKDIVRLKKAFDDLKVPQMGRRLVLCPAHVADLLTVDQTFEKKYNVDEVEGKIGRLYGFDIYEYPTNVCYDPAVAGGTKKAYGAAVLDTDALASVAFHVKRTWKASGALIPFLREAGDDPENRATVIGYSLRAMIAPVKATGAGAAIGAIRSGF